MREGYFEVLTGLILNLFPLIRVSLYNEVAQNARVRGQVFDIPC